MAKMMTEEEMRSAVSTAQRYEPGAGEPSKKKKESLMARMKKLMKRKEKGKGKDNLATRSAIRKIKNERSLTDEEIERMK